MRKLSLVNQAKDELTKEETQKIKAGVACTCYCTCYCECPPREYIIIRRDDLVPVRNEDLQFIMG